MPSEATGPARARPEASPATLGMHPHDLSVTTITVQPSTEHDTQPRTVARGDLGGPRAGHIGPAYGLAGPGQRGEVRRRLGTVPGEHRGPDLQPEAQQAAPGHRPRRPRTPSRSRRRAVPDRPPCRSPRTARRRGHRGGRRRAVPACPEAPGSRRRRPPAARRGADRDPRPGRPVTARAPPPPPRPPATRAAPSRAAPRGPGRPRRPPGSRGRPPPRRAAAVPPPGAPRPGPRGHRGGRPRWRRRRSAAAAPPPPSPRGPRRARPRGCRPRTPPRR